MLPWFCTRVTGERSIPCYLRKDKDCLALELQHHLQSTPNPSVFWSRQGLFCTPEYVEKKGELNFRKCNLTFLRVMRMSTTYYLVTWCTCSTGNLGHGELLFDAKARPPTPCACLYD